ncbi:MAG: AAA family ATPase [Candidatus Sericytochromatia bacterium]|nr:AAA family ATPase [Candidatus Sericytochromatia bacterium]
MSFPITLTYQIPALYGGRPQALTLCDGLTTFIGPNGSGKTQVLRHLLPQLDEHACGRIVRYLSAGRLGSFERQRRLGTGKLVPVLPMTPAEAMMGRRPDGGNAALVRLSTKPELRIKVTERLRTLFSRQILLEWDHDGLWIRFSRGVGAGDSYSSAREASGLLQLVVVLSALYDDDIGVLLLDEPEMSLHPQLQAFLLREIRSVAGLPSDRTKKLIVMSTHSTDMIAVRYVRDIPKLVFFRDADQDPLQVPFNAGELRNRKIQGLMPHFGETYKHALFTSRPLLVEGPSDSVICNALDDIAGLSMSAAGSQVVPVAGKGTMLNVVTFMRFIGKQPVILADLDGFADAPDLAMSFAAHPDAQRVAEAKGHPSLAAAVRNAYDRFANAVAHHWDDIAPLAQDHPYWVKRKNGEDQAKRRAALAALFTTSRHDLLKLAKGELWEKLQRRLTALFNLLESVGCFILRDGTIEAYFVTQDNPYPDKIAAALFEAEAWQFQETEDVITAYDDVLRALRFAANIPKVNDAQVMADLLLSFVVPILHRLAPETTDSDVQGMLEQILGSRSELFNVGVAVTAQGLPGLRVALHDPDLEVPGFPMRFAKGGDPLREAYARLRLDLPGV